LFARRRCFVVGQQAELEALVGLETLAAPVIQVQRKIARTALSFVSGSQIPPKLPLRKMLTVAADEPEVCLTELPVGRAIERPSNNLP
jgi:hypothetical protein